MRGFAGLREGQKSGRSAFKRTDFGCRGDGTRRQFASLYFFFDFLRGTFAPARRASERPIAIACLRLFTVFPDRPLFSVPLLRSCIARLTFCAAFLLYLAIMRSLLNTCENIEHVQR